MAFTRLCDDIVSVVARALKIRKKKLTLCECTIPWEGPDFMKRTTQAMSHVTKALEKLGAVEDLVDVTIGAPTIFAATIPVADMNPEAGGRVVSVVIIMRSPQLFVPRRAIIQECARTLEVRSKWKGPLHTATAVRASIGTVLRKYAKTHVHPSALPDVRADDEERVAFVDFLLV